MSFGCHKTFNILKMERDKLPKTRFTQLDYKTRANVKFWIFMSDFYCCPLTTEGAFYFYFLVGNDEFWSSAINYSIASRWQAYFRRCVVVGRLRAKLKRKFPVFFNGDTTNTAEISLYCRWYRKYSRERQRRRKKNAAQIYPSILNVFRNRSARYAVYDVLIRYHFYQSCDEQCFLR